MVLFTYLRIIVLLPYVLCIMVESIASSSTFEVVTCIDVPGFKYRFPTITDMLLIELFRFRSPVYPISFSQPSSPVPVFIPA